MSTRIVCECQYRKDLYAWDFTVITKDGTVLESGVIEGIPNGAKASSLSIGLQQDGVPVQESEIRIIK